MIEKRMTNGLRNKKNKERKINGLQREDKREKKSGK